MDDLTFSQVAYLRLLKLCFSPKRSGHPLQGHDGRDNYYPRMNIALEKKGYIRARANLIELTDKAFKK
jgi:hypothetical protein